MQLSNERLTTAPGSCPECLKGRAESDSAAAVEPDLSSAINRVARL